MDIMVDDGGAIVADDRGQARDAPMSDDGAVLNHSTISGPAESRKICGLTFGTAFKLAIVVVLVALIVLGLTVWDLDERIRSLLTWLEDNKVPPSQLVSAAIHCISEIPTSLR
jgi:hypothetical protein